MITFGSPGAGREHVPLGMAQMSMRDFDYVQYQSAINDSGACALYTVHRRQLLLSRSSCRFAMKMSDKRIFSWRSCLGGSAWVACFTSHVHLPNGAGDRAQESRYHDRTVTPRSYSGIPTSYESRTAHPLAEGFCNYAARLRTPKRCPVTFSGTS